VPSPTGEGLRFDFETWLTQVYGLKARDLTKKELSIAEKEYAEEYPKPGNGEIKLKTYPFKRYLDSKKGC
jgi:hypothetical protein